MTVNVLFVCLGNICRSPTAHAVFQQLVDASRLHDVITVDSAGTGDWHIGKAPDQRSTAAGALRGYDLSVLRARQVSALDFRRYHYILAMDLQNLRDLQQLRPADYGGELALFLNYGQSNEREVPDPYYGEGDGFEQVLDLVENAAAGLLHALVLQHGLQPVQH
jgi:low molecular weight protein-tyrosine phosphatase